MGGFIPMPTMDLTKAPPAIQEMLRRQGITPEQMYAIRLNWLGGLYRAGVRLVTGPRFRHRLADPARLCAATRSLLLLDAGASATDALAAATSVAATACGLGDRKGLLRQGFDADIVVSAGDLRATTGALGEPRCVVLDGAVGQLSVIGDGTLTCVSTTPTFVPVPEIAAQLGMVVTKVHQLIREQQLIAVRVQGVLRVPAEFIDNGLVVKGLPATITLLTRRQLQRRGNASTGCTPRTIRCPAARSRRCGRTAAARCTAGRRSPASEHRLFPGSEPACGGETGQLGQPRQCALADHRRVIGPSSAARPGSRPARRSAAPSRPARRCRR